MILKCAVIDDEPLARECLQEYIEKIDFLEMAALGSNALELSQVLRTEEIDLVFLDIQMPHMSGVDFLRQRLNRPMVVLTTAFPNYALEGYQLDVLDYLVKPIGFDRFFKSATKALDYSSQSLAERTPVQTHSKEDYFFIKCDYRYEKIYVDEIFYLEAEQNYVIIQTSRRKYMTLFSLKSLEEKLDSLAFVRVHKSFLVAINKIETLENHQLLIGSHVIPISRQYKDEVLEKVVNSKLWKKR